MSEQRIEYIKRFVNPGLNLMWDDDGRRFVSAPVDDIEWLIERVEHLEREVAGQQVKEDG